MASVPRVPDRDIVLFRPGKLLAALPFSVGVSKSTTIVADSDTFYQAPPG